MNTHNPYAPPSAGLGEVPLPNDAILKPRSVWMVQILGAFGALSNAFGLALFAYRAVLFHALNQVGNWLLFAWQLFLLLALLLMLWQLPKRTRLGRNLGLAMLALFAVGAALAGPGAHSSNSYYNAGQWLGAVVFFLLLAYLAFAFAFSGKARRYFSQVPT